ncbi:MAG: thiamine pyrophosphate-binding protein [Archangiaceae bacterium]|nr:thiamine pyrophosphate-binding protein [Archangiaceae bacterium]
MRALRDAGVTTIFGVPGGAISALYDALLDEPRIKVVNSRHESSAVFAAAAHARLTGTVGVVLATSGPGVTNAITGIASCFCDGLPVVMIGGEVPRRTFGRGALQEGSPYNLNIVAMVKHVTKWATEITGPDAAVSTIRKAMATANSGRRGPVFVSLPLDVQGAATTVPRMAVNVESKFEVDRSTLYAVVNQLSAAQRPMLLAGSGCRWDRGPAALRAVAERFQLPVATTPKAKGVFPETHPLSMGIFGLGGHPSATEYVEGGIDVLIAVGTSFGDLATNGWSDKLKPSRSFIQIDIDSSQIGRNYPVDLGLIGSAGALLTALETLAPPVISIRRRHPPRRTLTNPEEAIGGEKIKPQRVLWELQQVMPGSTLYLSDVGDHTVFGLHYLTLDQPDAFQLSLGLAAMGSSLGAAIGCKLADPERPVVTICGDGTLEMSGLDIADAAKLGLNVIYLVMNDGRYGMVENGHQTIFGRTPDFKLTTDVGEMAKGLGARVFQIDKPGDLLALGAGPLLRNEGPVVLDVRIDPNERPPRTARLAGLKDAAAGFPVNAAVTPP